MLIKLWYNRKKTHGRDVMVSATYEKEFEVNDSHCDFRRNLKLSEILNLFQEVATIHASQLNCSFNAMRERGYFWVLSRVSMDILRIPKFGDKIVVRTFPEKPLPLQCHRCYTIESITGERFINGYSMWCVLDITRNRLTPIKNIQLFDPEMYLTKDFDASLDKILEEPDEYIYTKIVRPSDIDANIHMNNTRYADIITDAFSLEYLKENLVSHLQINFLNQSRASDEIKVYRIQGQKENEFFVNGKIVDTQCFSSKICFNRE